MINWRIERYESLGSTSDLCAALAGAGEPAGLVIIAETQSAGRGRSGRQWHSPVGNFYASVLIRPHLALADAPMISLLTGVALAGALGAFLQDASGISLKWPNDVLLNGAKLAGILVESSISAGQLDWMVVGVGANLISAPYIEGRKTAHLPAGHTGLRDEFAAKFLDDLAHWLDLFERQGFSPIKQAWLAAAHPIGTMISTHDATGIFAGLNDHGALLLQQPGGISPILSGEIALHPAEGPATIHASRH